MCVLVKSSPMLTRDDCDIYESCLGRVGTPTASHLLQTEQTPDMNFLRTPGKDHLTSIDRSHSFKVNIDRGITFP